MDLTADDFFNQLQALLPYGPAWDLSGADAEKLLLAWAEEFARIQARADVLIDEADPRTTNELLADYERIFGLPTACMSGVDQTVEQRRNALVAQMTAIGGQSRAYFIALALAAGFVITITEFTPATVGMSVNDPIYGEAWAYAWQVNAPSVTITEFTVFSGVDEALRAWGNNLLECIMRRYKPAHTTLIFSYS